MIKLKKIKFGEARGKTIINTICDRKTDAMVVIFHDFTFSVLPIDGTVDTAFKREDFDQQMIDIFMPEDMVEVEEPQERSNYRMWSYGYQDMYD